MSATKTVEKETGGLSDLQRIVNFISSEGWDFTFTGDSDSSGNFLEVGMFDGTICLRDDGTWTYVEYNI